MSVPTSQSRRPGPNATNRRNHYRVLQVQPDAPFEVIRANYRALVQKLKLHPDLGGDHWTAAHINAAYHVLSNPVLRAAYDRELLATYDLATLAEGPVRPGSRPQRSKRTSPTTQDRRNFYRLLQVQPDAPIELIEASYRALAGRDVALAGTLAAALATLSDPIRREAYDRELGVARHSIIATESPVVDDGDRTHPQSVVAQKHAYEPLVTRYCLFCKTPHHATESDLKEAGCQECGSPLFAPSAAVVERARRSFARSQKDDEIGFYAFWPGTRRSGRLVDLSPTGLSFLTTAPCERGDVIKIDTPRLRAVGVIARVTRDHRGTTAGVSFHTVAFRSQSGSFVSARA